MTKKQISVHGCRECSVVLRRDGRRRRYLMTEQVIAKLEKAGFQVSFHEKTCRSGAHHACPVTLSMPDKPAYILPAMIDDTKLDALVWFAEIYRKRETGIVRQPERHMSIRKSVHYHLPSGMGADLADFQAFKDEKQARLQKKRRSKKARQSRRRS